MKNTKGIARTLLVSFNHKTGDIPVLIVGESKNNVLTVISAYKGQEAIDIYETLVKANVSSN